MESTGSPQAGPDLSHALGALLLVVTVIAGIGLNIFWYTGAQSAILTTTTEDGQNGARTDSTLTGWASYAEIAWRYYSPGVGVNPETGISRAKLDWDALTDWNTGSYIIACIEAHRLGLIASDGTWGLRDRMDRMFRHLLNRELSVNSGTGNWPYWAYYWDGRPYYNPVYLYTDVSDSGRLLYALDLLRKHDSSFAEQAQQVFQRCKTAYDVLSTHVDQRPSYYGVLEAFGFSAFGYDESRIATVFENWGGSFVNAEGQVLPSTITTAEPTLHGILELGLTGKFSEYSKRVYEAQRSRWARTGKLSGWSEGCHPVHEYVYEWIVSGSGATWTICKHDGSKVDIEPLMYTKVAFAYLAIFGTNDFTTSLFTAAIRLSSDKHGFGEAAFENGQSAISLWGWNVEGFYSDSTNQIILSAARYALTH